MYGRLALGILAAIAVLILEWSLQGPPVVEPVYRTVKEPGVGEITITNHGARPVRDWEIAFDHPEEITRLWGGTVVSRVGNRYTVRAESRNREIAPEGSVTVGFQSKVTGLGIKRVGLYPSYEPVRPEVVAETRPTPGSTPGPGGTPSAVRPVVERANYAAALQMSLYFYEAQRSGKLPGDNRVSWRGDSAITDGSDVGVDLTGGYYDAGDHVKFTFPLSSALTVLAWGGAEYKKGYQQSGQWPAFLATLRWGTDWLMKAHAGPQELYVQVGEGELDHAYWGRAETMAMPRRSFKIGPKAPGADVAGEAAAALAAAAVVFREEDPDYAKRLVEHAQQLFAFAIQYPGKYSDSVLAARPFYPSEGYEDEVAWAAAWLYSATGQQAYLAEAEARYRKAELGKFRASTLNWDDKRAGLAVLLARLTRRPEHRRDAEAMLNYWTDGNDGRRIAYTPGGLAWQTNWGALRYTAATAFLALVYSDAVDQKRTDYREFATRQMNYILGDNPAERSYVVGFGPNPPMNPHHRGAHDSPNNDINNPPANTHVLYGALVGGPKQPDDFSYTDDRTDLHGNEVALDYNAGFSGALARLVMLFGGKPLDGFPPKEKAAGYSGIDSPAMRSATD